MRQHRLLLAVLLHVIFPGSTQAQNGEGGSFSFSSRMEQRYGSDGYAALQRCSSETAVRLSAFVDSGKLDRLPEPQKIVKLIAQHGSVLAEYVMAHADTLRNPQAFKAFTHDPVSIAWGQRSLRDVMAERSTGTPANRVVPPCPRSLLFLGLDRNLLFAFAAGVAVGLMIGITIASRKRPVPEAQPPYAIIPPRS